MRLFSGFLGVACGLSVIASVGCSTTGLDSDQDSAHSADGGGVDGGEGPPADAGSGDHAGDASPPPPPPADAGSTMDSGPVVVLPDAGSDAGSDAGPPAAEWCTVDDFQLEAGQSSAGLMLNILPSGEVMVAGRADTTDDGTWWIVRRSKDGGTTWSLADKFQYSPGKMAIAQGVVADADGNLIVGGGAVDDHGTSHWVVRLSKDDGANWSILDEVSPIGDGFARSPLIVDGSVYVPGHKWIEGVFHWTVRKGGALVPWATVDSWSLSDTKHSFPYQLAADDLGNMFVAGYAIDANDHWHYTTRRSLDRGLTWKVVDDYQRVQDVDSASFAVGSDDSNVFTCGYGKDAEGKSHWTVRSSALPGNSFAAADDFQLEAGQNSTCLAFGQGPDHHMFAAGSGAVSTDSGSVDHAVVRMLTYRDGSQVWTTWLDWQYDPAGDAQAKSIATDASSGTVYALLNGEDAAGAQHWVVRKYPCAD